MPETSPPGAQPRSPPLDAARGCARCPTAEHQCGASARSKAQHLSLILPGLEGSRVETSPRFGSHLLSSQRLRHLQHSQMRFLQVPAAAGASSALCRGERGAEAGWHPALQAAVSRDAGGARGIAREGGRHTGGAQLGRGKKLHDPITRSQRGPAPHSQGPCTPCAASQPPLRVAALPGPGTHPGGQPRALSPAGSAWQSLLQSNSLPAGVRALWA